MSIDNLQIIFDNPIAVFIPGEIITGRVLIVVSNSIKIKSRYNKCLVGILNI